jgi:hypothetical protein
MGLQSTLAVVAFSGMALFCAACRAGMVGDPQHPEGLGPAIEQAYQNGDRDITIAPGTYQLPPRGKDSITLDHWTDATLHAGGVVLVFVDVTHRPVRFGHCQNVTFEGGTLRFVSGADTQGRVQAMGSDAHGPYCDWRVDAGYKTEIDVHKSCFDVVDQHTRLLKVQTGDLSPAASEPLGENLFRFRFHQLPKFAVGDWLITRAPGGSTICHVDESRNVTLKDVTLQNGGFATIFETGGEGNRYLHCKITYGPRPAGATEEEVVSCGADGFHSVGTTRGPDIEDCDFDGVFHDDCIAIHGTFQKVISCDGANLVLDGVRASYEPGESVRISDEKGFFAEVKCVAVLGGKDHRVELTLEKPLVVPMGAKANNPDRCGRGYKILRCHLGNTRSRGILVKADDGIIDGCRIEGCGMSAISVGPEYYWNEANYCSNVTISNNVIAHCVKGNHGDGAILVHGDGAIGNRHIVIKNNVLDSNYGDYILRLEWVDGVDISGNRVMNSYTLPRQEPGEVIRLAHARNITLHGNVVKGGGLVAPTLVGLHDDVNGIANNDATGIANQ